MEKVQLTNQYTAELENSGLAITRQWDAKFAMELVKSSLEPTMREFVPKDAIGRFPNQDRAQQWYESDPDRVVYRLGSQAVLGGMVWFSRQPRTDLDAEYTFGIRLYQSSRGRGLAGVFLEATHDDFFATHDDQETTWLETDVDNISARTLYKKHGYEEVDNARNERILMIRRR